MVNPVAGMEKAVMGRPRPYAVLTAPKGFSPAMLAVWQRVVSSRPPSFYDEADIDMLTRYVRLEVKLKELEGRDAIGTEYIQLVRLSLALARALRISKTSVIAPQSATSRRRSPHRKWLQESE